MSGNLSEMSQLTYLQGTANGYWPTQNSYSAMAGGDVEGSAIADDTECWTASGSTGTAGSPTKNGSSAMGGGDVRGRQDIGNSTAASSDTDEQWPNAHQWLDAPITPGQQANPFSEEMLLAHQSGTCRPCIYFYSKLDSCRKGAGCDHCHICSQEEARAHQREKKKRAIARKSPNGPRARQCNNSIPSFYDQRSQEDESLETTCLESCGSGEIIDPNGEIIDPNILQLLESTTHQVDTTRNKKWVCEACNETVRVMYTRDVVTFLTRQCQPGPPAWMHPSHVYTRDVGKIMCNVCFGYCNGLRVSPRLKKPCPGGPETGSH